jgi:hypothetical protein
MSHSSAELEARLTRAVEALRIIENAVGEIHALATPPPSTAVAAVLRLAARLAGEVADEVTS